MQETTATPAPEREWTTEEAAAELDIPFSTLKRWLQTVAVPHRTNTQGHRRFGPEGLEALRMVKDLRLEGDRALESIRRIMDLGPANKGQAQAEPEVSPSSAEAQAAEPDMSRSSAEDEPAVAAVIEAAAAGDVQAVVAQVIEAIRRENQVAEAYARAAHRVGQLEATVAHLEEERDRFAGEAAAGRETQARLAQSELERAELAGALDREQSLRRRLEAAAEKDGAMLEAFQGELSQARELMAELLKKQARPWWRFWGG